MHLTDIVLYMYLQKVHSFQTMSRRAVTRAPPSSRRFGGDITAGSAGRSFATLAAPSLSTERASESRVSEIRSCCRNFFFESFHLQSFSEGSRMRICSYCHDFHQKNRNEQGGGGGRGAMGASAGAGRSSSAGERFSGAYVTM